MTALVGAPTNQGSGSGYIFSDSTGTWIQLVELHLSTLVSNAQFGESATVAGSIAIFGVPGYNPQSNFGGATYAYQA